MGTITARKRADGSTAYTAQIRLKDKGVIVHSEAQTFTRKALAQSWLKRRESELEVARASGSLGKKKVTVGDLLEGYTTQAEGITEWGRSKTADIRRLKEAGIADKDARLLTAADLIEHCKKRRIDDGAGPATVLNDMVWLRQAFLSASARYGISEPMAAVDAAKQELLRTKVISKPQQRDRRLSSEEERLLTEFFGSRDGRAKIPMLDIFQFALITARRQEEICRIRWEDVDFEKGIAWLDDVKHPRMKKGNRRSFRILKPAMDIIDRQSRTSAEVFPYSSKSVGAAFTRACHVLEIKNLHFHDLRHEATSRLFEKGYSIQEVAQFTLHESWATLKRYTHLRPENVPER
ncbi:site-specific integrase [Comamonas sp. C24C]